MGIDRYNYDDVYGMVIDISTKNGKKFYDYVNYEGYGIDDFILSLSTQEGFLVYYDDNYTKCPCYDNTEFIKTLKAFCKEYKLKYSPPVLDDYEDYH